MIKIRNMIFFHKTKLFIIINYVFIKKELSKIIFKKKENIPKYNNKFKNFNKYAFNKKTKKTIAVTSFVNMFEYLHHEYLVGIYLSNFLKKNLIFLVDKNDYKSKFFFESLKVEKIIFYDQPNLIIRYQNLIKSFFKLTKMKNIKDFLKLKENSIATGKMLYSHYVRFSGVPTIKKIEPDLYWLYSQYLGYSQVFKKIIKNNEIEGIVQSETQFMPGSILTAQALKKKANIFSRLGIERISLRKINNIKDHDTNRYSYDKEIIKKIRKNKNSKKIIKLGKKILYERFFKNREVENQEIDEYYFHLKKKKLNNIKDKSTICKLFNWEIKKPVCIIFANNLTDGLFEVVNPIYHDNYKWLQETLKEASKNKNINWLIKPHPREIKNNVKLRTKELVSQFNRFDHIKLLPDNYQPKELLKIINAVFTSHGTAGYEYPSFGIPAINAADSIYSGLNIAIKPKNIFEYKKLIRNFHNKYYKLKFDKNNACIFAYVWSVLGNVEFPSIKIKNNSYSFYKKDYWREMNKIYGKFQKINKSNIINDTFYKSLKFQIDHDKKHTLDLKILKNFKINY